MSRRVRCQMCDDWHHLDSLSPRGWCNSCESEFEAVMNKIPAMCQNGNCSSPFACSAADKCLKDWESEASRQAQTPPA